MSPVSYDMYTVFVGFSRTPRLSVVCSKKCTFLSECLILVSERKDARFTPTRPGDLKQINKENLKISSTEYNKIHVKIHVIPL